MQRKWRTNPGALDTVLSYPDFRASIPPRDAEYTLTDPTDLYAVYTVLHIERKQAELRWSPHGRFYYFLAQWEEAQDAEGHFKQQAAAPEGDEDPPPQIVPEGSSTAPQPQAAAEPGSGKGRGKAGQQQQQPQDGGTQHQERDPQQQAALPAATPEQQQDAAQTQAVAAAAAQQPAVQEAAQTTAAPLPPKQRTQILVPVSSGCRELTPRLLQRFFSVRGVQAQQLLLALVDSNGVVTRSCLYNYIQAPLEGPGTANLELLDD